MLGGVLTAIGGILLAIVGVVYLAGYEPLEWLQGITGLVLGIGLLLFMRQALGRESGREARERTETRRLSNEARKDALREAERGQQPKSGPK